MYIREIYAEGIMTVIFSLDKRKQEHGVDPFGCNIFTLDKSKIIEDITYHFNHQLQQTGKSYHLLQFEVAIKGVMCFLPFCEFI